MLQMKHYSGWNRLSPLWHYSLLQHYLCGVRKHGVSPFLGWLLWTLFWSSREAQSMRSQRDTAEWLSLTFREGCGLMSPILEGCTLIRLKMPLQNIPQWEDTDFSCWNAHWQNLIKKKKIWYPTFYFPSTSYQNGIHSYDFKAKSLYNSLLKVHLNSFWTIFLITCCQCNQYVQNLIMSLPVL